MKEIKIGLIGFGTVGTGVARILIEQQDLIRSRVGACLVLKHVADIDTKTDRGLRLAEGVLTNNAQAVVDDPDIDIIVEMIGGEGIAKDLMLRAIDNGKSVVTANKALLASQGNAIFRAADEKGVDLAFEASIGGCMPIVKSLRESLVGNQIQSMIGILNGTCNYILTKISDEGSTFDVALAEAQAAGFAEADPTLDVEGIDTAHKLALLSSLAYGMEINLGDIYTEGISGITPFDIRIADEFGYRIKLLAISKCRGDVIEARVHPTMIPVDNLLSRVGGSLNAITLSGDSVGDMMLCGHGAGMMPTASAVVGDIVDIARNLLCQTTGRLPLLSYQMAQIRKIPIIPVEDIFTHYYFRFLVLDQAGVLSKLSGILGKHDISMKSVQQKGPKINGSIPLVILSHLAKEADVRKALAEITALKVVSDKPMFIRIEDDPEED